MLLLSGSASPLLLQLLIKAYGVAGDVYDEQAMEMTEHVHGS